MESGAITSYIDVAQVVLYAFWIFFAGLIFYLRREDRREGYPLLAGINELPGNPHSVLIPQPKTFLLSDGRTVTAPNAERADTRQISIPYIVPWPGGPILPTVDAMGSGVGPGSYAQRADIPDVTFDGHERIVPMRVALNYTIADGDPEPKGMLVLGADKEAAGTVCDAWVDRSECFIRYLEVELRNGGKRVLLPINFASIDRQRRQVTVDAILAAQFANVPGLRKPDTVTLLEEEKVMAYYGGGTLFATPDRQEPLI